VSVAFLLRALPYIGGALLAVAAYYWAYNRGADHVQADWDAAKARGVLIVARKNAELQSAKDAALAAGAERERMFELANRPIQNEVNAYVKTAPAAARCVDAAGVSIGNRAIAAANAATATP
jgi:hypothetical protein